MALTTSRISVLRGRPPGRGAGISGFKTAHWASVISVGYGERLIFHYRQPTPFGTDSYLGLSRLGGYRAAYSTPLIARCGDVLGTIATHFQEPHRPSERQTRLVELYARQVADFVQVAGLMERSGV